MAIIQDLNQKIHFELWSRVHTLPHVFVEWWQLREFKRLCTFAYNRVPFYKKLWAEKGVCPDDIKTYSDIQKFPIVSKQLLRHQPIEEMMNEGAAQGTYEWLKTSGSTGEPLRFPSPIANVASKDSIFYKYRFLMWRGIGMDYLLRHLRVIYIVGHGYAKVKGLTMPGSLLRDNPGLLFRQLKEFSPYVLEGRPTEILQLAQLAKSAYSSYRISIPYICFQSEAFTQSARRFVEDAFGGEVYDIYGLKEFGDVGVECRVHCGLHINEESFVTEIVDENDNVLPSGKEGRIVLTRLHSIFVNVALPFIRYATGDKGAFIEEPCPCGLKSRRLTVCGRETGYLDILGRKFHFTEFSIFLNSFSSIMLQYQLAKTAEKRLELRMVPAKEYSMGKGRVLSDGFREKFGLAPTIKLVKTIAWTPASKIPYVIDETREQKDYKLA